MPSTLTHALIPLAFGKIATDRKMLWRFWVLSMACSALADADTLAFRYGIPYGHFFGHRGFFHSLFFAVAASSLVVFIAFRKKKIGAKKWWLIYAFFLFVSMSHGLLDMLTRGGLGIAVLSPFDATRYASSWKPILVSEIGFGSIFTRWGFYVLISEITWIWLPLAWVLAITKMYRILRNTKQQDGQSSGK